MHSEMQKPEIVFCVSSALKPSVNKDFSVFPFDIEVPDMAT
jgi:hypothetical protein